LYIPAALSLIVDFHTGKTRSLAVGIHMTGLYMGQALGGFGAAIASSYTWQVTFHSFGIIGILYSLVLIFFLREKKEMGTAPMPEKLLPENNSSVLKGLGILFTNISFWVILFYFTVPSIPGWSVKNWLPTLFAQNLSIDMSKAGPIATITISVSSFLGVITGGILSDRWVRKNIRGRVYTSAIGIGLTIPALLFIGFGHTVFHSIAAAFCFGFGFGMFDANNMPILCQFVSSRYRATAYGIMNMVSVFAGAFITDLLGKFTDSGHLGIGFAMQAVIVLAILAVQLYFLRPKVNDFVDA